MELQRVRHDLATEQQQWRFNYTGMIDYIILAICDKLSIQPRSLL